MLWFKRLFGIRETVSVSLSPKKAESRAKTFVRKVRKLGRKGEIYIRFDADDYMNGAPKWPEMRTIAFRSEVLELLHKDPDVVCAVFNPPDEYDACWVFTAAARPLKTAPGHCMVCDHHHITDGRCSRCDADQTIRLWVR